MNGLPKYTKEELVKMSKNYKNKVDFKEFLPNSIMNTPKKKPFSNTFKTQSLNLYKVRGGYGNNSTLFNRNAGCRTSEGTRSHRVATLKSGQGELKDALYKS